MKILASNHGTKSKSKQGHIALLSSSKPASREEILSGIDLAPLNVEGALNALETVAGRLREKGDPRAVFPDVYAVITRRVKEAIEGRGPAFLEPQWISRLAGLFCEYYLAALGASLDGRRTAADAWDVAFHSARGTATSMNALLGINAHINYDLAQGLYDNIVQHGAVKDARLLSRYHHDHDLVNEILASAMPEIFQILVARYKCPLAAVATVSKGVQETISRAVLFTLRQWRDRVWCDLEELLAASSPLAHRAVLARMNRRAALVARALITGNEALVAGRPIVMGAVRALPFAA
jgi:hypothetical protein